MDARELAAFLLKIPAAVSTPSGLIGLAVDAVNLIRLSREDVERIRTFFAEVGVALTMPPPDGSPVRTSTDEARQHAGEQLSKSGDAGPRGNDA